MRRTHRSTIAALALALPATVNAQQHLLRATPASADHRGGAAAQDAAERLVLPFWRTLGDTTLERLLREALRGSHDVRGAAMRLRAARSARAAAAFDFAPTVTTTAGYTRQRLASRALPFSAGPLPEQDVWDAGLQLSWEVDVFGRVRRSVQGYGALGDAAEEDLRDTQLLLSTELAGAYFALRGAQDRLAVARRNAENQRGTRDVTLRRLEGGRGTELDSARARAQLSATLAEIPALEAAVDAARVRIAVLAGRDPRDPDPALDADAPPIALPAEVALASGDGTASIEAVVRERPDVKGAERRAAASHAFLGAARAEYLPRVSLAGASGYTGSAFDALGKAGTPRFAIGPVISWAALDLGRVRASVDGARAAEQAAQAQHAGALLRARGEAETALVTYRRARERLAHLDEAATASARAAELARLRFTEGASDFLQVLDAERTLLEAQDRRAAGHADAAAKLVAVYRALGGGWPRAH